MFYAFALAVLVVSGIDYVTGLQVTFTSAHMALIFFASQKLPPRLVYTVALFSVAGTFAIDFTLLDSGQPAYLGVLLWRLLINAASFLGTALLCNSWNQVHRQLQDTSDRDYLTGLSNRRHFTREVEREIDIHSRSRKPFAIAFVDVDDFKAINDTLGHSRGDEILVEVAATLAQDTRSIDLVCRHGGDEFVIFLREVDLPGARDIIQRVQDNLNRQVGADQPGLTFSTGVVGFTLDQRISVDTLVGMADREMYKVKKRDKNGISAVCYDLCAHGTQALQAGQMTPVAAPGQDSVLDSALDSTLDDPAGAAREKAAA